EAFAESSGLPVACSFRFQDLFDNRHGHYVGDVGIGINPKLAERVRGADLLLVIGARLGEMTTGAYTLVEPPRPKQKLVHVHAGVEELGRVYQVAPTNGSMGYGVPAGVAAKVAHPERVVVSINGDGDFLMNGQELATAVQYGLPVIFVVVNNGMYGTIRMHQERDYPARVYGTALQNPDFAALARAYGAHGELVEDTAGFAPAFERATRETASSGKPALIEVRIDPQAITTST